jgi:hypothetical protein
MSTPKSFTMCLMLVAMVVAVAACGDDDAEQWTGEARVDSLIHDILDGDRDALRDALATVERPCSSLAPRTLANSRARTGHLETPPRCSR